MMQTPPSAPPVGAFSCAPLLFPPHPALADVVQHGLIARLPGQGYRMPASLTPLVMAILSGGITVRHEGRTFALPRLSLCGGTRGIRTATAEPGTQILVLSLHLGCLDSLFGLPVSTVMEEVVPLAEVLPAARDRIARFEEGLDHPAPLTDRVAALQDLLRHLRHPAARRVLPLPPPWLERPVADIAAGCGLSLRQFERRFATAYGQSWRGFRRQSRCGQMLARFVCGNRSLTDWAGLAAEAGYADQAHLCRDVLAFTGHTPTELARGIARSDPAFWPYGVSPANLQRLFGPSGF